jgi:hypothetical protein
MRARDGAIEARNSPCAHVLWHCIYHFKQVLGVAMRDQKGACAFGC